MPRASSTAAEPTDTAFSAIAGLGAHALGDRERLVEAAVEHPARGADGGGDARTAPSAGRGSAARRRPSSRGSRRRGRGAAPPRARRARRGARASVASASAVLAREEAGERRADRVGVAAARDHLDAVAGRDDRALGDALAARPAGAAPARAGRCANASRSRTSTGAVRWFRPTRTMPRSIRQNAFPCLPSASTLTPTSDSTITAKPTMVSVAAQRPRQPAVMRPWSSTT